MKKHELWVIGNLGDYSCYLDIPRNKALQRYKFDNPEQFKGMSPRQQVEFLSNNVKLVQFDDEFEAYDVQAKGEVKILPRRKSYNKDSLPPSSDGKYTLRLYDMFDGWIDIASSLSPDEAISKWEEETKGGTEKVCYDDRDYYAIFPGDTKMVVTPEFLGR